MAKRVQGPDGRIHLFPDNATDAEIAEALEASAQQPPKAPSPAEPSVLSAGMFGDFGQLATETALGAAKGAGRSFVGLGRLFSHIPGLQQISHAILPEAFEGQQAETALGLDPTTTAQKVGMGAEQVAEFFIPGPAAATTARNVSAQLMRRAPGIMARVAPRAATEATSAGVVTAAQGGGTGDVALGSGVSGATAMIPAAGRAAVQTAKQLASRATPAERAAVQFGAARGVPIDAATETSSPFIQSVQKNVSDNLGGANIAERFKTQQAQALTRVSDDLATAANPATGRAVDPVGAGERVRGAVIAKINALDQEADQAYAQLRQIAARNRSTRARKPGAPIESMELPVDLRSVRDRLRSLHQQLLREKELVGVLQGGKARALVALDSLMTGPDFAPLTVVDKALGDLKAMARGAALPALRTEGQGAAAAAVRELDTVVQQTAASAGPDALKALQAGRKATVAKYEAADVLDLLQAEPRATFNALTAKKDAAIERLRAVQRIAPEELPNVGRALLEDLFSMATERGRFEHTDKLWSEWQKLGPATKKMLFSNPGHVKDLDHFFLLAKRIGENPNPSGTARQLNATKLLTAPMNLALAKSLYQPDTARQVSGLIRTGRIDEVFALLGQTGAATSGTMLSNR